MKKRFTSNSKIKYLMLSILFSIMFIFTAVNISTPITAYAAGGKLQSNSNGKAVNGTEVDSTSTANYLFWAASADRTGILFYIIDNGGRLYGGKKLLILDDTRLYNDVANRKNFELALSTAVGVELDSNNIRVLETPDGYSTKPVIYSNGWHATGNVNTLLNATTTVGGEEVPYWYYYATMIIGASSADKVMQDILASDSHWTIVAEPVSIQYIYSDSKYNTFGTDTLGHEYSAGDPLPAGSKAGSSSATPYIFCATANNLSWRQTNTGIFTDGNANPSKGGTYTYKFINMALPWSMCLERDQKVGSYAGGSTSSTGTYQAPTGNGEQLDVIHIAVPNYATGLYFIDVSVMRQPIHTFWAANGTPGDTEPPSPDNGTTGNCIIKKLYYTEILNADGTIKIEATDYHKYRRVGTTNYISIDFEEGYENK